MKQNLAGSCTWSILRHYYWSFPMPLSFANILDLQPVGILNLFSTWRPQTSERSAIDFGSYLYLILKLILYVRHVGIGISCSVLVFMLCMPFLHV